MQMEMKDDELGLTADRLTAAAAMLEQAVERLTQRQYAFAEDAEATIGRIVRPWSTPRGRAGAEAGRR